jgi:hypothetical protein
MLKEEPVGATVSCKAPFVAKDLRSSYVLFPIKSAFNLMNVKIKKLLVQRGKRH